MAQQQQQQQQHLQETPTSSTSEEESDDGASDGYDHEEVSCCLEDTDSFMLRKREFLFPGLPPGARTGDTVQQSWVAHGALHITAVQ